jgi:hypothetical protein
MSFDHADLSGTEWIEVKIVYSLYILYNTLGAAVESGTRPRLGELQPTQPEAR